jgi:serine/threonine-protein kinase
MPLATGTPFGSYTVLEAAGSGGMGEVYRARDEKLGRNVALKILPASVAGDTDRVRRFENEAQLLASLNHPNVAVLHGIERVDQSTALVLEYVDGETLAERLQRGPLPIGDARSIASQVCAALAAAHDKSIVHRDLKPQNLKIRPDGTVKVLDFGIAKALAANDGMAGSAATITSTAAGLIVGTPAYMSPEQARGLPVDRRTDLWAFGCVVFEMLSGTRAFDGDTATDVLAAVIGKDPDWARLPQSTPENWRRLLQWCLEKDVNRRLRDAGDAALLLDAPAAHAPSSQSPWRGWAALTAAALTFLVVGWVAARWTARSGASPSDAPLMHLALPVPGAQRLGDSRIAMSAAGDRIAFVAATPAGRQLHVHAFNEETPQILNVAEPAEPFFAPNGESLGFVSGGRLQLIHLASGRVQTVCPVRGTFFGGTISPDGRQIVYASGGRLYRVDAGGGDPVDLQLNTTQMARHPQFLPAGNALLFTLLGPSADVIFHDFSSGRSIGIGSGSDVRYLASGHVAILRGLALYVARFDSREPQRRHSETLVASNISQTSGNGGRFAIGEDRLIYAANVETPRRRLVMVDRNGGQAPLNTPVGNYQQPRVSPDGTLVLLEELSNVHSIWTYELSSGVFTKLSMAGAAHNPIWSADGARIIYNAGRETGEPGSIYVKSADGTGREERIVLSKKFSLSPMSWTRDGRILLLDESVDADRNILAYDSRSRAEPKPWLSTPYSESSAVISPDGRWVAYVSNQSRRDEVYVRPLSSDEEGLWQVSTEGGLQPIWARDGRQLFYRRGNATIAVSVATSPVFRIGASRTLFEGAFAQRDVIGANYDVLRDGKGFIMLQDQDASATLQLHAVLNWRREEPGR